MLNIVLKIVYDLMLAVVTGVFVGLCVDYLIEKRRNFHEQYDYWERFLYQTLESCDMYIPIEQLKKMPHFKNDSDSFQKAIFEINDILHKENAEDKELNEDEVKISQNVLVALQELYKWKNENILIRKTYHKKPRKDKQK